MSLASVAAASAALGALITFVHWHQHGRVPPQRLPTARFVPAIAPNAPRRGRLARPLLWALRLAVVAALGAAVRPRPAPPLPVASGAAAPLALVVDTSASMAQPLGGATALAEAKRRAAQAAQKALSDGRCVGLFVAAGPLEARLDVPMTHDGEALLAALAALPLSGHATLDAALARADAEVGRGGPPAAAVVFTDGAAHAWETGAVRWPTGVVAWRLEAVTAAETPVNDAVLDISAARQAEGVVLIEARLARFGGAIGERTLRLMADDVLLQRASVSLSPGRPQTWRAQVRLPTGLRQKAQPLAVSLQWESAAADALSADDSRIAWLLPAGRGRLAAVTDAGRASEDPTAYVARALAHPSADETAIDVAPRGPLAMVADSDARALLLADVGTLPGLDAAAGAEALARLRAAGRGVWQALGDSAAGTTPGAPGAPLLLGRLRDARAPTRAPAGGRHLGEVDWTHPLLAQAAPEWRASLRAARVFRYWQVEATRDAQVVMSLDDGSPLLLAAPSTAGAAPALGPALLWTTTLSPQWTDLPLRSGFVPWVRSCVTYLLGGQAPVPRTASVGETFVWRDGETARTPGRLRSPSGATVVRMGSQQNELPMHLSERGRWRAEVQTGGQWRAQGAQDVWVQAAVADSDLTPLAAGTTSAPAGRGLRSLTPAPTAHQDHLWLLLAALLLSVDAVLAPSSSPKKAARVGVVPRV